MMIIQRPHDVERISKIRKWTLVFGRRKTGKTFIVTNFINEDEYFFVKTNKSILSRNNESLSYESFLEILKRQLGNGKTVVVDEFHRLEQDFFDFLHYTEKKGRLILISSTLFLSKKLLSSKSALLGFFAEIPIGLISLNDTLNALAKHRLENKDLLELAILLREPIAVDYFDSAKSSREIIASIVLDSVKTIPALVGEIFSEEEREISAVYEGVLRGISTGKVNSGALSSYLYSKKLIKKDDPSIIQQYLNNLISFGIIRRIGIYGKKRFAYKVSSPLARIFYYLDEKYNISERPLKEKDIIEYLAELMPKVVEDNVREYFAEELGLTETILQSSDYEVDGCLLKFKKPDIALEIKWGACSKADISKAEQALSKISARKMIIFVQDKKKASSKLMVLDVNDLTRLAGMLRN